MRSWRSTSRTSASYPRPVKHCSGATELARRAGLTDVLILVRSPALHRCRSMETASAEHIDNGRCPDAFRAAHRFVGTSPAQPGLLTRVSPPASNLGPAAKTQLGTEAT